MSGDPTLSQYSEAYTHQQALAGYLYILGEVKFILKEIYRWG